MQTSNNGNSTLKKISFSTSINAPKEKVWDILWQDENYRAWTSAFSEGSYAASDWNEGSKIQFLDGKGSGMYSTIEKKIPNELMSFRHIGEVKDGVEQPLDEKTKSWSGGRETYKLEGSGDKTALTVELDVVDDFLDYLSKTFPKALQNVKDMAEGSTKITVQTMVNAPVEKVWEYWSAPEHITRWNSASEDWHTPRAENDLRTGGTFSSRMESRDGSMGFDFGGVYDEVKVHETISYTMGDGRQVRVVFDGRNGETAITETFDAESTHPVDMQRAGWQAILDNFKKYVEQQ